MTKELELASDPATPLPIARRLMREPGPARDQIREAVASRPDLPMEDQMDLVFDRSPGVRSALASNSGLSDRALAIFVISPHLQRGGADKGVSNHLSQLSPERRAALEDLCNGIREGRPDCKRLDREDGYDVRVLEGWRRFNEVRENFMSKEKPKDRASSFER